MERLSIMPGDESVDEATWFEGQGMPLEMIPEEGAEAFEGKFRMTVEDILMLRGRGAVLYGYYRPSVNGKPEIGDTVLLLDKDFQSIAESHLAALLTGQKFVEELDEECEELQGLLISNKRRSEVRHIAYIVIK